MESNVMFDRRKLQELRAAYAAARQRGASSFEFDGQEIVTDYAKYMIEYLEWKLEGKQ